MDRHESTNWRDSNYGTTSVLFSVLQANRNLFKASSCRLVACCPPVFYYPSAHIRLPPIDGSVMTRTCRIRPGPEQRSSANQSSSIMRRECENLQDTHTHTHMLKQEIAGVADCWVTGVQTEEESENYSFFPSSPPPFKEKQLTCSTPPCLPSMPLKTSHFHPNLLHPI